MDFFHLFLRIKELCSCLFIDCWQNVFEKFDNRCHRVIWFFWSQQRCDKWVPHANFCLQTMFRWAFVTICILAYLTLECGIQGDVNLSHGLGYLILFNRKFWRTMHRTPYQPQELTPRVRFTGSWMKQLPANSPSNTLTCNCLSLKELASFFQLVGDGQVYTCRLGTFN